MGRNFVKVPLSEIAEGGLQERFDNELARVVENCMDTNTDSKKKRKITINITVTTDDFRQDVYLDAEVKSTLAPRENIGTRVVMDKSGDDIYANELRSGQRGQMFFDPQDSTLKDDKGTPVEELEKQSDESPKKEVVEPSSNKVIHTFKKQG